MGKEFYIGQIFDGIYPAQAAFWCKKNNAQIETKTRIDIIDGYEVEVRYYEIIATPEPTPEEKKSRQIEKLKEQLNTTDKKIIKCSEYQLVGVALPYDIAELHAQRQALRDEINKLEEE